MLDKDQQTADLMQSTERLLVMQTPRVLDEDLLWDAVICFAEDTLGFDVVDERVLSWHEVKHDAFEKALKTQLRDASNPVVLRSIRAPGCLAVIAPEGYLKPDDWLGLKEALTTSQEDDTDAQDWRVIVYTEAAKASMKPLFAPIQPYQCNLLFLKTLTKTRLMQPLRLCKNGMKAFTRISHALMTATLSCYLMRTPCR